MLSHHKKLLRAKCSRMVLKHGRWELSKLFKSTNRWRMVMMLTQRGGVGVMKLLLLLVEHGGHDVLRVYFLTPTSSIVLNFPRASASVPSCPLKSFCSHHIRSALLPANLSALQSVPNTPPLFTLDLTISNFGTGFWVYFGSGRASGLLTWLFINTLKSVY